MNPAWELRKVTSATLHRAQLVQALLSSLDVVQGSNLTFHTFYKRELNKRIVPCPKMPKQDFYCSL